MQAPRPSESPARPSLAFSWGGIIFRTPPFQAPQAEQPGIARDVSPAQQPGSDSGRAPLSVPVPNAETRSVTVSDDNEGIQNNHGGNEDDLDSDHHGASPHHHSDDLSLEDDSTLVAKASTNTYTRARLAVSSSQASTCSQSDVDQEAPHETRVPAISEHDDDGGIKPDPAVNSGPSASADARQSYTIHAITDFRIIDPYQNPKEVELRISWEGFPDPSEDTWEDERELHETCPDLVFDFWAARSGRSAALGLPPNAGFEVLRICRHQTSNRRRRGHGHRFLVEWVGYREKTWEPASHLPREILEEYFAAAGRV